jgi:hypothetical protein
MNCNNCNARLSCGCQKKTASDGKSCCANCLASYENNLKSRRPIVPATSAADTINKNIWSADKYTANK